MRWFLALWPLFLVVSLAYGQQHIAPTDALTPEEERKSFKVPDGFEVQLVASEVQIHKPMQIAFDAKGRLWVTTSRHYPFAAERGKSSDKIFILSDFANDGHAKTVTTFDDKLNIPIGILPLPDGKSCIVSSVGEILKLTDTDGDGKADLREVLFTGFGTRDTHGMTNSFTLMPDGWVYACHGFSNESTVVGKDGHEVKMQSGNTFRFRTDGSRIEVFTRGQVNPFGMTADPWFNLYTADCHSKPITQLIKGAYYDSFGKPHDGLGYAPHVTRHDHGSTGLCGLAWYDADHFPKEWNGCMFLGNVVTNRINIDRIEWKGSTPVAKELPDFLVSSDPWFRPTDIKLGPDGALYVSDFYNKIIGHYEVDLKDPRRDKDRGRIWRIVWTGKDGKAPAPEARRADWATGKLAEFIDDAQNSPNATVRALAAQQALFRLQRDQKLSAAEATATFLKLTALTVGAKETPEDGSAFRHAMLTVRIFAAKTTWSDDDRKQAVVGLGDKHAKLQRAVVEAVGFHPHADFVAPLVAVLKKCPADDVLLKQATRIALRNCFREEGGWAMADKLAAADPKTLQYLVPVALGVRAKPAAQFLTAQFDTDKYRFKRHEAAGLTLEQYLEAVEHIGRYGSYEEFHKIITIDLASITARPEWLEPGLQSAATLVRAIQAVGGKSSAAMVDDTRAMLDLALGEKADPKHTWLGVQLLVGLLATRDGNDFKYLQQRYQKQLVALMARSSAPNELRAEVFELVAKYALPDMHDAIGKMLRDQAVPAALLDRMVPVLAADPKALAFDGIQDGVRDAMKYASSKSASNIAANLATSKTGADVLLRAAKTGHVSPRVLQEKVILERLRTHGITDLDKKIADLTKGLPPADQRLADVLKKRAAGFASAKADKVEGAKLFTKHCAACHKIADVGGKIAPQLDGIGLRGLERLLEDVLDPNRNVDQAFRARVITTSDDRTITALMLRVEGEVLVVADLEGKEKRIPLKDITLNRETLLSAMPANFDTAVPEADMYHIIAYLLDQKKVDPPKK